MAHLLEGLDAGLRSLLRLERGAADRGTLVHAWLERVGWLEDGEPTDGELREIARSIVPGRDAEEVERDRDHFRSWLRTAAIRAHLLRASYPPGATVEREVPFLHRSEGRLVEGVIDRLTLMREDGVVIRAEILDYKTDSLPAGDADARGRRVAEYRPQLDAYRAAVRGWYSLPPEAVEARLVFLDSALVVEV